MSIMNLFRKNSLNGALWVGEDDRDFLIWSVDWLPELFTQDTKIIEYNQGSSLDCTLYNAIWAISDLYNYEFSDSEIKEIVSLSYEQGRTKWKGWYTQLGVKCVCNWWNEKFPDKAVRYDRLDLREDVSNQAMDKNYTLCTTYKWNAKYNLEYLKYLVITSWDFWTKTYWHAINMIRRSWKRIMKDSYKGRETKYWKSNIYEIQTPIEKLIPDTYYPSAYLITKINNVNRIEELKRLKEFELQVKSTIDLNSQMRETTNDKNLKDHLHKTNDLLRNKLIDIQKEFDKIW